MVNNELFDIVEQLKEEGQKEKFTAINFKNGFLAKARAGERSIVYDSIEGHDALRKSVGGGLLR